MTHTEISRAYHVAANAIATGVGLAHVIVIGYEIVSPEGRTLARGSYDLMKSVYDTYSRAAQLVAVHYDGTVEQLHSKCGRH